MASFVPGWLPALPPCAQGWSGPHSECLDANQIAIVVQSPNSGVTPIVSGTVGSMLQEQSSEAHTNITIHTSSIYNDLGKCLRL